MLEIEKNLEGITNVFRANEKIASNNICKQVAPILPKLNLPLLNLLLSTVKICKEN